MIEKFLVTFVVTIRLPSVTVKKNKNIRNETSMIKIIIKTHTKMIILIMRFHLTN